MHQSGACEGASLDLGDFDSSPSTHFHAIENRYQHQLAGQLEHTFRLLFRPDSASNCKTSVSLRLEFDVRFGDCV